MEGMDQAADEAAKEIKPEWGVKDVAEWWQRHYQKAGHKRLGRVLLGAFKKAPSEVVLKSE